VIYPVKCLAKVHQASKYSSGFLVAIVQVFVDEVQHLNKVVVDRAAGEATKRIKFNVRRDVRPDPLDQKSLEAFAEEGGEAKVTEVIFRLGYWHLINWKVVLLLVGCGPAVGGNGLFIDGGNGGSQLRQKFFKDFNWQVTWDTACLLSLFKAFKDIMVC
jgi:hypothetical protein